MCTLTTSVSLIIFCLHATATTVIHTLSLHDALPILDAQQLPGPRRPRDGWGHARVTQARLSLPLPGRGGDRKSTRLNSSHQIISYAVFCLKKKNLNKTILSLLDIHH